ncbi:PQQ-binding-like beta-propeller repeat protein [Streptomyces sp. MW-W600-10]|uniref:outer membrane protein assembly factor BamB family protein n=1 Tax=Streptomyces sp. MW-W600-10 TaxID=2829819 RepID=UPI001C4681BD|nr:PQQ-binding-like beta-propeller repeat protein [Streptomyces sp. MW-W600-10]MBV7246597.1 PQQ-binding-like beta-propeller repeat protein [Streptomyces sp. MW-W600-10]
MSQPPQPPQQPPNEPPNTPPGQPNTPPAPPAGPPAGPPSGGFGAPQDPPPGGFGQPTPPPADPFGKQPQQPPQQPDAPAGGYGTPPPAAPGNYPTPPAPQPNGYGYPQAPQPGYGYPQGPAGQPGMPQQAYGYPTQPMQPQYGAPQQPGVGKKFSTQMQIIVAAAVAVVLIIGAGVIYAATGDDDKGGKNEASSSGSTGGEAKGGEDGGLAGGDEKPPANTKSKVALQLPEPQVTDITTVMGSWITDKAYVKSGVAEIVAYDLDKGTKLWSVPLPGEVCSASRHMSKDYKTAIVFEETKATKENKYPLCNQVGVVDMAAGKLLWSKGVTSATGGDQQVRFDEVTLSGSTVAAGGTSGGAAFKLETGAELWKPKVGSDGCYDRGYGGGEALAVVRKCGTSDSPQLTVQALNPTTGAPLSSFQMPAGVDYASIVSTKPLVVAADVGDTAGDGSGISDFFSIDAATGKLIVRIPADAEQYAARCGSTEVERCQNLAVGNNRLYLPTENHDGTSEYGDTNEIVAFDLTTGKLLGARADAGDRYSLVPLRMDGTSIIAYKEPPYDKGGQIVSIDGETFKQTLLMENPSDEAVREAERRFSNDHSELLYSNGHFFKSKRLVSKRSVVDADDKLYLVVGYRTD